LPSVFPFVCNLYMCFVKLLICFLLHKNFISRFMCSVCTFSIARDVIFITFCFNVIRYDVFYAFFVDIYIGIAF
jgi:hypothetical protein